VALRDQNSSVSACRRESLDGELDLATNPQRAGRASLLWHWLGLFTSAAVCQAANGLELVHRPWFEARSAHFQTYSCGPTQEVAKLTGRLEQFHTAYSSLAGTQAVASPPIVVMAFPDHPTLQQFVPLYQGKPTSRPASSGSSIVAPMKISSCCH